MAEATDRKTEDDDVIESAEGVGIGRAKEILGELANRAGYGNERIVLVRRGRRVAAVIGMKDLERLAELDAREAAEAAAA